VEYLPRVVGGAEELAGNWSAWAGRRRDALEDAANLRTVILAVAEEGVGG
jgi:hypothetical protein